MNWIIGIFELTDEQMEKARANNLSKNTVQCRIYRYGWDAEKAVSTPVEKKRTLVRGHTEKQVLKRTEMLKKMGWVPLMDKPKLDPGSIYAGQSESYVMVLEGHVRAAKY